MSLLMSAGRLRAGDLLAESHLPGERFPTEVRGAASAFCYHIGAIFGGAVPVAVTLLAGHGMGLATAMLSGTVVGAVSFCLAPLMGPETRGTRFVPDLVVA
jgi:MFS transporter, SHS family, lactate transporter